MRFVHPEVLWGMLALSVPIIVHLFNFRKFRKVSFSNVAFLKEIRQETHKTRNLKHLLILLMRMLAITCLVFAFARPYFPGNDSGVAGISAVSIYIDNSRSMEARGSEGILLEMAKYRAITIAESFSNSDRFQLLTTDFEGKHQRLVSKDEFIQLVQEVVSGPSSQPLSEAAQRQLDLLLRSEPTNRFLFQLTDLQRATSNPSELPTENSIPCSIYPQSVEVISNIFIDSVWFESPVHTLSRPDELHVRLVNTGEDERKDVPIRWIVNEVPRSVGTITVPANSSAEIELSCSFTEAGNKVCTVELDDNGITSDDQYYFNYDVLDIIPVLEIRGSRCSSNSISAIFSEDDYFSFRTMNENQID
ncbi:MAG: BatA domain-containing protein, partial [Flavobacteriales bacterium]